MADKRISQLVERVDIANDDVLPIVANGAVTTNKVTISTIQDWMQENLDVGVTSVGITIGSTGTDVNVTGSPVTSSGNITINLPTASATNRGLLSAADWVTFNSKQDAGSFVTLDTAQTITAQKTFTTSGSSDTMIISHGSGSGFALDVLKAGNGEAIRVTKTSGTGNAMTISGGNFEAGTIVKTGGTSSQFLKADGSVDSSTYLTTGTASSTYVPYSGATGSVNLGVYNIAANAINSTGSGSIAGQINLRSDTINSLLNGYGSITSNTSNAFIFYQTTGAGVFRGAILSLNSITASATRTYTLPDASGTLALSTDLGAYLPLAGGTLTGALNGTKFAFSSSSNSDWAATIDNLGTTGANGLYVNIGASSTGKPFAVYKNFSQLFGVENSGAATFSSSVSATGLIINNNGEALRAYGVSPNVSFYNSANTVRGGYVNHDGSNMNIVANVGGISFTGAATFSSSVTVQSGNSLFVNNASNTRSGFLRTSGEGTELSSFAGAGEPLILIAPDTSASMRFYTGGSTSASERMRITSGGYLKASNTGSYLYLANAFYEFNQSAADWIQVNSNTVASGTPLGVVYQFTAQSPNNSTSIFITAQDSTTSRFYVRSDGGIGNYQANNVNLSDERTKKDIEPLESYWDKFKAIEIVKFKYKDQTHDDFNIGVIAQQVESVAPEFVDVDGWDKKPELDEEGNEIVSEEEPLKSIYTADLHHATIKVLQEAMAKIEELQVQIDSLKNQMQ